MFGLFTLGNTQQKGPNMESAEYVTKPKKTSRIERSIKARKKRKLVKLYKAAKLQRLEEESLNRLK